jgi:hypothetical protein
MKFSKWVSWDKRNQLADIEFPGVYAIAISKKNINDKRYSLIKEIVYFGMTNSEGGLKSRLQKFDNTIKGKEGHGGAERFRFKYRDYKKLCKLLYVAIRPFHCDVKSNESRDLLKMGEVAKYEYVCFADYVKKYKTLPDFNDKKRSRKKEKDDWDIGEK